MFACVECVRISDRRDIAKIIGCDCASLVAQNRLRYPGIRPGSKLRPGTTLTFHPDDEAHEESDEDLEPSVDADVAAAVQAAGLDLSQLQGGMSHPARAMCVFGSDALRRF